jgi:hypothetical protein
MDDVNDIAEILKEDTKQKKIVARKTIKSKPAALPTTKEMIKKSSSVTTLSLYDTIMPYTQFLALDRKDRLKALDAYCERFTKKEIAEKWGLKSVQSVHDHHYRLKRSLRPAAVNSVKPRQEEKVLEVSEELAPAVVKVEEIFPLEFKIIKELSGNQIQNFTLKFLDFFDEGKKIQVDLDIRRAGHSLFNIHINASAIMSATEFSDQIITNVCLLPKEDNFFLTLHIKELTIDKKEEA